MKPLSQLTFSNAYFVPEAREGFYVSEMMKRYWAAQLLVLKEIAAICARHQIPWYADNGSLLGAVRHGGYIPWDDDFDIAMMRHDMKRFLRAAEKELPEGYVILDLQHEEAYTMYLPRIVNARKIDFSDTHMARFFGCPYTVGIDIFPLDGLYADEEKEEERRQRAQSAMCLARNATDKKEQRKQLLLAERFFSECDSETASHVALMPVWVEFHNHRYDKNWFAHTVEMSFEGTAFPVPACYEDVLRAEYGDFMRIVKSGGVHDYPVYGEQEQILRNRTGYNPWRYTYTDASLLPLRAHGEWNAAKEIVFLAVKASWWHMMEETYRAAKAREGTEVTVIVVPYIEYAPDGSDPHVVDESALFPPDVPLTKPSSYDFARRPDVIVMQHPYDGECTSVATPDFFAAANIKQFTDCLVYLPCHDVYTPEEEDGKAKTALRTLIEQPAVMAADRVIVASKGLRDLYVETLCELTGAENRERWEEVIVTASERNQ